MKTALICALAFGICALPAESQIARGGRSSQVAVQNRSVNRNNVNVNRNNNANVNRNVNVNQNTNVNVNRNVNVHGGCCYYQDNSWNWGSFAAGAAAGAVTTAAVASATRPTTVVAVPAVGSVVTTLPGGCGTVNMGGAMIYHCSSVYYRPYYQGTTLVYQVVTYP
jgi:hypothetical protein